MSRLVAVTLIYHGHKLIDCTYVICYITARVNPFWPSSGNTFVHDLLVLLDNSVFHTSHPEAASTAT
jgi:hypothetical protein